MSNFDREMIVERPADVVFCLSVLDLNFEDDFLDRVIDLGRSKDGPLMREKEGLRRLLDCFVGAAWSKSEGATQSRKARVSWRIMNRSCLRSIGLLLAVLEEEFFADGRRQVRIIGKGPPCWYKDEDDVVYYEEERWDVVVVGKERDTKTDFTVNGMLLSDLREVPEWVVRWVDEDCYVEWMIVEAPGASVARENNDER